MNQLKTIFSLVAFLGFTQIGFSQGAVSFQNVGSGAGPTSVNAPITNWDGALVAGGGFFAQLYMGASTNSLAPVGVPVVFSSGGFSGYFFGGTVTNNLGFGIGSTPVVIVRAWDNNGGALTNYFDAIAASKPYGESSAFTSPGLGDSLNPSTLPVLQGLNGFALVPEPSITVLAAIGALGVFLRARRKV